MIKLKIKKQNSFIFDITILLKKKFLFKTKNHFFSKNF